MQPLRLALLAMVALQQRFPLASVSALETWPYTSVVPIHRAKPPFSHTCTEACWVQGDHKGTQGFAGPHEQALCVLRAESSVFSPTERGVRSGSASC